MTEKQEKILDTALRLFAENGFDGTSTSKIAKESGVSEGLIFRHFSNKDGLLQAIMDIGNHKMADFYQEVSSLDTPKSILKACLSLPLAIPEKDYPFWRLIYALKWKSNINHHNKPLPLKTLVIKAFTDLHYQSPLIEAETILVIIDGLATSILLGKSQNMEDVLKLLLNKYDLEKEGY